MCWVLRCCGLIYCGSQIFYFTEKYDIMGQNLFSQKLQEVGASSWKIQIFLRTAVRWQQGSHLYTIKTTFKGIFHHLKIVKDDTIFITFTFTFMRRFQNNISDEIWWKPAKLFFSDLVDSFTQGRSNNVFKFFKFFRVRLLKCWQLTVEWDYFVLCTSAEEFMMT